MTVVELKKQRTALKAERQGLVDALRERDLTDEQQAKFDDLSNKIDALTKRIDALEKVENDDDPDDDEPEEKAEGDDEDEDGNRSAAPKPKKKGERHLDFSGRNISTSKTVNTSDQYSLRRALSLHTRGRRVDGLEGEISRDIEIHSGNEAQGFFMPWNFKCRGRHKLNRRDFTTTTGAGAVGVLVEAEFIELLRNRMVTDELGVKVTHSLKGKYAVPRQNSASQLYFIGEGSNGTGSTPGFDQVDFTPRTATCQVNISRKSLFEMSIEAETAVENDMLKVLSIGLDFAVLAQNGSGANPTGIIYDPNVTVLPLSADTGNGADMTFGDALNFEYLLSLSNADMGSIAFCTTNGIRSKLKQTPKINSGQVYPEFVWNEKDNTINGYKAVSTNQMPSGLTKGTSSNLHSIIYGNWNDSELALWGGIDVVKNPFINVSSGAIQYNLFQEMDTQRQHSNSFVVSTAVSTA
jgi:HK97 family phage major capsid protein